MATPIRIAGQNLKGKQQLKFALTPIRGIGKFNVKNLLEEVLKQMPKSKLTYDDLAKSNLEALEEETIVLIRNIVENSFLTEDDLRRKKQTDIKRLVDLGTWRGKRHKANLPVRGQTTRTNSRTIRGNKRNTGGSGRAKSAAKT